MPSIATGANLANRDMLWACYLGMADCFEQAGALDSALVYNDRAMEVMESQRAAALSAEIKAEWLRDRALVYEAQVHVMAQLHARDSRGGYDEMALATAERGKAQALRDILSESSVNLNSGPDPDLANERVHFRHEHETGSAVPKVPA